MKSSNFFSSSHKLNINLLHRIKNSVNPDQLSNLIYLNEMLNDSKARCSSGNVEKKRNLQQRSNIRTTSKVRRIRHSYVKLSVFVLFRCAALCALDFIQSQCFFGGDDFGIQSFCKSKYFTGKIGCQGDSHLLVAARYHDRMIIFMLLNSLLSTGINSKWMWIRGSKQITASFTLFTDFQRKKNLRFL